MAAGGTASYLLPIVTILIHILFPPFLFVLGITILLASFGKSLGIRKLYVRALIRIFDFARKIATEAQQQGQTNQHIQILEKDADQSLTKISDANSTLNDKEIVSAGQLNIEISKQRDIEHKHQNDSDSSEILPGSNLPMCLTSIEKSSNSSTDPICTQKLIRDTSNTVEVNEDIHSAPHIDENNYSTNAVKGNSAVKNNDVAYLRQRLRGMGRESRHNVISRRDNLMLSPDQHLEAKNGIIKSVREEVEEDQDTHSTKELINSEKSALSSNDLSGDSFQREFELDDVYPYIKTGIASIIEDEVTQRFVAEELKSWNLLTRTSQSFEFVNIRLTIIWIVGFIFRYCLLLPGRALILFVGMLWLSICMAFVGHLPDGNIKKTLHYHVYTSCFQIIGGSLSAVITFHNTENKPKKGICVANHTSPIDVLILACDNAYALIGQMHGGFLGQIQAILSRCSHHIWFERSETKDRALITNRLREHVEDPDKLPILIFPEGTCINNTSVMQFKKGSFEVGGTIYPVAIKYDPLFGDAFWNSSKHGMLTYIYLMMTSWAIVCDVWYLPPMTRKPNEDAVTFANRVKAEIARQGGLVDLMWDGNLKRSQVKSEWKGKQQQAFAERIKIE